MKAKMVQRVEGQFLVSEIDAFDVSAWGSIRGMTDMGPFKRRGVRSELIGWPVLSGMCGPMWDGDCIRYEDSEANDILST